MLLIDWHSIAPFAVGLIIAALSFFGLRHARKMPRGPRRIVLLLTCLPLCAIASLGVVLLAAGSGCISRSAPIYSPSRRMALRIVDADEGAAGGSTSVDLFWAHGFRQQTVYMGGWKSVGPSSIEWKSDTELTIHYGGGYIADAYHGYSCTSTAAVTVRCSPR